MIALTGTAQLKSPSTNLQTSMYTYTLWTQKHCYLTNTISNLAQKNYGSLSYMKLTLAY